MAKNHRALSPVDVYDLSRAIYPKLGLVTVYRTLEKLEGIGLIQRVHQVGGCNGYIAAPSGHQHLLICQSCGRAEYFSGDDLSYRASKHRAITAFGSTGSNWLESASPAGSACKQARQKARQSNLTFPIRVGNYIQKLPLRLFVPVPYNFGAPLMVVV